MDINWHIVLYALFGADYEFDYSLRSLIGRMNDRTNEQNNNNNKTNLLFSDEWNISCRIARDVFFFV